MGENGNVRLTHHHGLGNDFLVALVAEVPVDASDLARRLCDRDHGSGADGRVFATTLCLLQLQVDRLCRGAHVHAPEQRR